MADKIFPESGLPIRRTVDLLPEVFKTETNSKFTSAVLDPLVQPGVLQKTVGYVGRRYGKTYKGTDSYLDTDETLRSRYQLEPSVVIKENDQPKKIYDYIDFKNQLKYFNNELERDDLFTSQDHYSWDPPIDWDKFINFREYYWVPSGPPSVKVLGQNLGITSTYRVRQGGGATWILYPDGLTSNPTLTLYRGQSYRFEINSPREGFTIRTAFDTGSLIYNSTLTYSQGQLAIFDGNVYKAKTTIPPSVDGIIEEGELWELLDASSRTSNYDYNNGVTNNGQTNGDLIFDVPIDAPDVLFYQSSTNPDRFGKFIIADIEENTKIDIDNEIIGKITYKSSNDIELTNGLIVRFAGQVVPSKYARDSWLVEGVGESIRLIKFSDLEVPIITSKIPEVIFDNSGFDTDPFDDATSFPGEKDYITICRGSIDSNPWSRYNRWFHKDVLDFAYRINGSEFDSTDDQRAKRPIIEFKSNLQLFNHGSFAKQPVDLIDDFTKDVFSIIEGSQGYSVDGQNLFQGARVLFTADTDSIANNKIYRVDFIEHNGVRQIALRTVDDSESMIGECVLVRGGNKNKGLMYHYDGSAWVQSQRKTQAIQPPIFDLFDDNGISFSNQETYPSSNFVGSKIISYKEGSGLIDSELGFALSYLNIDNVGDILFQYHLDTDFFSYSENENTIEKKFKVGYFRYNPFDEYANGWIKSDSRFLQPVIDSQVIRTITNTLKFDSIYWQDLNDSSEITILFYVNGERYKGNWSRSKNTFSFDSNFQENDVVSIKIYSSIEPDKGYYQIPYGLEKNPLNQDISNFTLGQAVDHLSTSLELDDRLIGNYPGKSNLRDLEDYQNKCFRFLKHSGIAPMAIALLCDKEINIIKSIRYNMKSYTDFKNEFLKSSETFNFSGKVSDFVDTIINYIGENKDSTDPFSDTDMIGSGAYTKIEYEVEDEGINVFSLSQRYDLNSLSRRAVYVYINDQILIVNKDYEFDSTFGFVRISRTLSEGDKIEIREYVSTAFNYIPATPTKLGLYKKFIPEKFLDDTYTNPIEVIRGHDGSITVAYGDYRDDILLELENRIYNNIKQTYDSSIFDIDNILGGYYNNSLYNKQQLDNVVLQDFLRWTTNLDSDYTNNLLYFDPENSFTYTYSNMVDPSKTTNLPGYWKGVYLWFYDTIRPHTHPWEMLGITEKPDWWETVYGPAPYTRNNLILWEDIKEGIIRQGPLAGTYPRYARTTILSHIPVDDDGNLLSPLDSGLAYNFTLVNNNGAFKLGDVSPVEYAWRSSSEYPFSIISALCLLKPFEFITDSFDRSRLKTNVLGQTVSISSNTFLKLEDIQIPVIGDLQTSGLINYVVSYIKNQNLETSILTEKLSSIDVNITTRLSGFVDQTEQKYLLDSKNPNSSASSIFVPPENYDIIFNVSVPIQSVSYSGVLLEKREEGWSVRGYNNQQPYFNYFEPLKSNSDPEFSVGGKSIQFLEWTSDKNYVNGDVVRYSNSYYRAIRSHSSGVDFDKTNWQYLPKLPVTGGISALFRRSFATNRTKQLVYGTTLKTVQDVVDFLLGYEKYLISIGMSFDQYDAENQITYNWATSCKEFMFWTKHNWSIGSLLSLSPSAQLIDITIPVGVGDNLLDSFYDYEIYKSDGTPLLPININVLRDFQNIKISTVNTNEGIYFIRVHFVVKEHITVFDDRTVFNDVIYEKTTGYRQERIKSRGFRTTDWDGDYTSPGFLFDNVQIDSWQPFTDYRLGDIVSFKSYNWVSKENQIGSEIFDTNVWEKLDSTPIKGLVPNFDYRINQFEDYFDVDSDGLGSSQRDLSRHTIGYQSREYLQNLAEDNVTQFKLYQGFIREKGTNNSITKVFDKLSKTASGGVSLKEEWAFRVGRFGGIDQVTETEFEINKDNLLLNPQPFLINPLTPENEIVDRYYRVPQKDFTINQIPFDKNIFPVKKYNISNRTAGYVNINDIDFAVATRDDILNLDIGLFKENSHIWVTFDNTSWTVLRFNVSNLLEISDITITGQEITLQFNRSPNLVEGSIIGIKQIQNLVGFYKIKRLLTGNRAVIEISADADEPAFESSTLVKVYLLHEARFENYQPAYEWKVEKNYSFGDPVLYQGNYYRAIKSHLGKTFFDFNLWKISPRPSNDLESIAALTNGAKIWIDSNSSGKWEVIEKTSQFNVKEISSWGVDSAIGNGTATLYSSNQKQVISTMPSSNIVIVYGNKASGLGISQIITPPSELASSVNSVFGESLALSPDGKWLAIGSPNASSVKSNYQGIFDPLGSYIKGDIVIWEGKLWRAKSNITYTGTIGTYSVSSSYAPGDVVFYGPRTLRSITTIDISDSSINQFDEDNWEPAFDLDIWEPARIVTASAEGSNTDGYQHQGTVSMYEWTGQVWAYRYSFISPRADQDKKFGYKISIGQNNSNYYMSISSPESLNDTGRVYLYKYASVILSNNETITYRVTLGPAQGSDSGYKFYLNESYRQRLDFEVGNTYIFDQTDLSNVYYPNPITGEKYTFNSADIVSGRQYQIISQGLAKSAGTFEIGKTYKIKSIALTKSAGDFIVGRRYQIISTGIQKTAPNLVVGRSYRIISVGTTNWNSVGVPSSIVPAPGVTFVANSEGTGTGTAEENPTNFTLIGAANNTIGTIFTATGVGTGTGTAYEDPTDFTLIGASNNTIGTIFTATGIGTGKGFAYEDPTDFTTIGASSNDEGTTFIASGPTLGTGTVSLYFTSTNPHPLGFSSNSSIGTVGGGISYTTNVVFYLDNRSVTQSQYISNFVNASTRRVEIKITEETPNTLYYYSSNIGDTQPAGNTISKKFSNIAREWQHLDNQNYKGIYDPLQYYTTGSIVWSNGNLYQSLTDQIGTIEVISPDATTWIQLDPVSVQNSLPSPQAISNDGSTLDQGLIGIDQLIEMVKSGDRFGTSLAMSRDASLLAIGTPFGDNRYFPTFKGIYKDYQEYQVGDIVRRQEDGEYYQLGVGDSSTVVGISPTSDPWTMLPSNEFSTGKVFIYKRNSFDIYELQQTITSESLSLISDLPETEMISSGDLFGYDLDLNSSGDTLVISSPLSNINNIDQGSVLVFKYETDSSVGEFRLKQKLQSYEVYDNQWFGSAISINEIGDRIVVAAKNTPFYLITRFDTETSTTFDGGRTIFLEDQGYPGQVYVYELKDRTFLLAEKLSADFKDNEGFGTSIDIRQNSIVVGSPSYRREITAGSFIIGQSYIIDRLGSTNWNAIGVPPGIVPSKGIWFTATGAGSGDGVAILQEKSGIVRLFEKDPTKNSLNTISQEEDLVNIDLLKSLSIFDIEESFKIADIDIIDPVKMKILGRAEQEIRYKTPYDPAIYTNGTDQVTVDEGTAWFEKNVGLLWWNLSKVKWLHSEQGDLSYRSATWNQLAPGATVEICEWVESEYSPAEWTELSETEEGLALGISGIPLYDNQVFSFKELYNIETGEVFGSKYYFWVKNKNIVPDVQGRNISSSSVAELISNPQASGLPIFALVSQDKFISYNLSENMPNNTALVNFEFYKGTLNRNNIHNEYQLLVEDVADSLPTESLENKWIDSLVGYNQAGNPIPEPSLPIKQRYGLSYRPAQSMFVDRGMALKIVIDRINTILATQPFADLIDFENLNLVDGIPSSILNLYDILIDTKDQILELETSRIRKPEFTVNLVDGSVDSVNIINRGFGYRTPPVLTIDGDGSGAVLESAIDNQGRISSVTVINQGRNYSYINVTARDFAVLVVNDIDTQNYWAIYSWNQTSRVFVKSKIQSFDTTRYWSYIDWYSQGIDVTSRISTEFSNYYQTFGQTFNNNEIIRIKEFASGGWALLQKVEDGTGNIDGIFNLVARENGTIAINDTLYQTKLYDTGSAYDEENYDNQPTIELRNILKAVKENIFIGDLAVEWNKLFFASIKYIFSEQLYVDWAFKTSFLNAVHNVGELEQKTNYRSDNLESFQQYLEEVKPYRTTIREYTSRYDKVDVNNAVTTDFDLPPIYDGIVEKKIVPVTENSSYIDIYPFKHWKDNKGYSISTIEVFNSGSGYITPPKVSIVGDGTGAEAQAYVSNGRVSGIVMLNSGSGYTYATISLVGGNGFSENIATAYAILGDGKVRSSLIGMRFDRVTKDGSVLDYSYEETFEADGFTSVFNLKFPPTRDKSKIEVTINNEIILDSDYSISFYYSSDDSYKLLRGKISFSNLPADGDIILVSYEKDDLVLDSVDRINKYYNPTSGMLGKDVGQLMTGIDFGGVQIQGTTFDVSGGWDALPWFTDNWDSVEPNSDFYYSANDSTTSVELPYVPSIGQELSIYLTRNIEVRIKSNDNLPDEFRIEPRTIRIDDPNFGIGDGSTVTNPNALIPTFIGDGSTRVVEIFDYFSTQPGDVLIFRPLDSDGTVSITDANIIDTNVSGGTLSAIDQIYQTATGLLAEDIVVEGGKFITPDYVPAPEENVPGQVLDSVSIKVFHKTDTGAAPIQNKVFKGNGVRTVFDIGIEILEPQSLLVFVDKIKQGSTPTDSSIDYTIDWNQNTITFVTPPELNAVVEIFAIGVGGVSILDYQEFEADGQTSNFLTHANYSDTQQILVTVDGVEVDVVFIESGELTDTIGKTLVQFNTRPSRRSIIKIVCFSAALDTDSGGYNVVRVNQQVIVFDGSTLSYDLDRFVNLDRASAAGSMLVECKGLQLKGVETTYYVYDGVNNVVKILLDPLQPQNTVSPANISLYSNNELKRFILDYTYNGDSNEIVLNTFVFNEGDEIKIVLNFNSYYRVENNNLILQNLFLEDSSLNLQEGDEITVTWFSEYPSMDIITDQYQGGQAQYKLQRSLVSSSYVWVYRNGIRLTPVFDYEVVKGPDVIRLNNKGNSSDEIKIVQFGEKIKIKPVAFEIFKDMLNVNDFKRYSISKDVVLAQDLNYYDQSITVSDASSLFVPVPSKNWPGMIYINGERIEYFNKNGNVLSQLRRGTQGTPIAELHQINSKIADISRSENLPYGEEQDRLDFVSDGSSLIIGPLNFIPSISDKENWTRDTIPAEYGPCDQIEVFFAGRRLRKDPISVYDQSLGAISPEADVVSEAEFSVDGINPTIRLTNLPENSAGKRITVIRKIGKSWYDVGDGTPSSGKTLVENNSPIFRFLKQRSSDLPE